MPSSITTARACEGRSGLAIKVAILLGSYFGFSTNLPTIRPLASTFQAPMIASGGIASFGPKLFPAIRYTHPFGKRSASSTSPGSGTRGCLERHDENQLMLRDNGIAMGFQEHAAGRLACLWRDWRDMLCLPRASGSDGKHGAKLG